MKWNVTWSNASAASSALSGMESLGPRSGLIGSIGENGTAGGGDKESRTAWFVILFDSWEIPFFWWDPCNGANLLPFSCSDVPFSLYSLPGILRLSFEFDWLWSEVIGTDASRQKERSQKGEKGKIDEENKDERGDEVKKERRWRRCWLMT